MFFLLNLVWFSRKNHLFLFLFWSFYLYCRYIIPPQGGAKFNFTEWNNNMLYFLFFWILVHKCLSYKSGIRSETPVDISGLLLQGRRSGRAPRPCRRRSGPAWRSWTTWRRWAGSSDGLRLAAAWCSDVLVCVQGSQKELLNLSQQDYANRIEELNQSLKEAWASDQKVKALKIVIQVTETPRPDPWAETVKCLPLPQCSKLLSDTAVIQFYPSKFVLITDILDTFGGWSLLHFLLEFCSDVCSSSFRPSGLRQNLVHVFWPEAPPRWRFWFFLRCPGKGFDLKVAALISQNPSRSRTSATRRRRPASTGSSRSPPSESCCPDCIHASPAGLQGPVSGSDPWSGLSFSSSANPLTSELRYVEAAILKCNRFLSRTWVGFQVWVCPSGSGLPFWVGFARPGRFCPSGSGFWFQVRSSSDVLPVSTEASRRPSPVWPPWSEESATRWWRRTPERISAGSAGFYFVNSPETGSDVLSDNLF